MPPATSKPKFDYWNLPNKLGAYPDLLKAANLMESSNKRTCILILNHCVKMIEEREVEFLEMFPTRKLDLKTLKRRIGLVEEKLRKEIAEMRKRVCDDDVKSEIDQIRKEAYDRLDRGELIQALSRYEQVTALINQYRHK
jgi:hypothetical protein